VVEGGSALVNQAGATMNEIVQAIQRVSDIVGEISSAQRRAEFGRHPGRLGRDADGRCQGH